MKKFQEKKKWKDIVQSKPVLILFGIVLITFAYSVFGLMNRMQESRKNRIVEENKIQEFEQRKNKLSTDIANLKTEKGVEENIREKFGLVKEGEGMIVVVDEKDQTDKTKQTSSGKFVDFFKNFFK